MRLKLTKTKVKCRKVLFIFESVHTLCVVHVRAFVFIKEVICPLKSNLLVAENTTYHLEKHTLPPTHITPTTHVLFSPPSSLFPFPRSLFFPPFLNLSLPLSIPPLIPPSILFLLFIDPSFLWFLDSSFLQSLPPLIPRSLPSSFDPLILPLFPLFLFSLSLSLSLYQCSLCPSTQYRVRRWQLLKNTRTVIGMSCLVSSWHL